MGRKIRRPGSAFLAPLILGLAVPAGTCSPGASPPSAHPVRGDSTLVRGAVTDHVIVISMDGFRPDAIARIRPRTIGRLAREGSHILDARTIVPSRTLPGHMSMVSGEPPDVHGVVNNDDPDETRWRVDVPTIFHLARERGFHTAAFFSKTKFRQIHEPGSVVHSEKPANPLGLRPSWSTAGKVERYRTMDTAATAMWLPGIPRPADWVGSPVVAAFDAGASPRD